MSTNVVQTELYRPFGAAPWQALRPLRQAIEGAVLALGALCVLAVGVLAFSPDARESAREGVIALLTGQSDDGFAGAAAGEIDALRIGHEVALDPVQARVAQYLARRYHVADDASRVLVAAAVRSGREHRVDPQLVLAVAAVESSLNPLAQSSVGATGIMQVMPGLHSEKFGGGGDRQRVLDPVANIRAGSEILGELIRRGGSVERGLQLYVGAGNLSDDGGYALRVLAEAGHIRLAAQGDVAGALAAAQRADLPGVTGA
jgi:soluble lytic murein transglycosylase-like protein